MKKTGRIQILKHMRNLFLFILLSASSVWAKGSYSQETQLKMEHWNRFLIRSPGKANWSFFTTPMRWM